MRTGFRLLVAAVGEPHVEERLFKGAKVGNAQYKVHIYGDNRTPALQGQGEWPRTMSAGGG